MTHGRRVRLREAFLIREDSSFDDLLQSAGSAGEDGMSALHDEAPSNEPPEAVQWAQDHRGRPILDATQLQALRSRGYEAEGDLVYHPDHWQPAGHWSTGQGNKKGAVVTGERGAIRSISKEAERWATEPPWWRPVSGKRKPDADGPDDGGGSADDVGQGPEIEVFQSGQSQVGQDAKYGRDSR